MDELEPSSTRRVALRKESVDRNADVTDVVKKIDVALRKESVDRNLCRHFWPPLPGRSLSARRAWIEIADIPWAIKKFSQSLSARRAWIEIWLGIALAKMCHTSLSARRAWIEIHCSC